jgi:hypothetical protein
MLELYKPYTIEEVNELLEAGGYETMSEELSHMNEKEAIKFFGAGKFTTTNKQNTLTLNFEVISYEADPATDILHNVRLYVYEIN